MLTLLLVRIRSGDRPPATTQVLRYYRFFGKMFFLNDEASLPHNRREKKKDIPVA